jgi:hypothetical protein
MQHLTSALRIGGVVAVLVAVASYLGFGIETVIAAGAAGGTFAFGMILDERTEFCDATALSTAATGLALIGDVIDSSVARNVGNGKQLFLVVEVTTAVTSGGAATVAFVLASDAQAAIAVDGTASEHARTQLIAVASLVAGYRYIIAVPPEGDKPYERYLGLLQNVGVAALTAGNVNAFLTFTPNENKAYPNAI